MDRLAFASLRSRATHGAVLAITLFAVACTGAGDAGPAREDWVSEVTTDGDVTTVRTVSGSVWGAPARLQESLSIGVDQGEQPYMLGRVGGIAAHGDRIYVLDGSVPVVRVYDRQGAHVEDIGAEGDGPGEFRDPDGLVVGPDGRLYVRDMRVARITIFENDGTFVDTWPLDAGFIIRPAPFVMTDDGTVWSPGRIGDMEPGMMRAGGRMQMGMVPRGPQDSDAQPIPEPTFDYDPPRFIQESRSGGNVRMRAVGVPFSAQIVSALSPSGAMIAGVGTDYSFDIIEPEGPITRVVKDAEPVAIDDRERDWNIEQTTAQMRQSDPEWVWEGPEVATVKPAFNQLLPDHSGRVWVGKPGPGIEDPTCERDPESGVWDTPCWRDSVLYDVFDLEGAYLGSVDIPAGFRLNPLSWIDDRTVLTAVEDDMGVITVKRYELVVPSD